MTVVFADLSGFTALSERTDPEEVRSMVDRCMSEMGEVVERFGGSVDKVIGDALMAVFGAPVAHEDDSERAVRAALEIQRRASEQAADFGGLCVSIGINTGEVIFAPVGPHGRRELTVMGDAVNTAARLQAAAPPEVVLVGEETRAASARAIAYEAGGADPREGQGRPRGRVARSGCHLGARRASGLGGTVHRQRRRAGAARADVGAYLWRAPSAARHPRGRTGDRQDTLGAGVRRARAERRGPDTPWPSALLR